MGAIETVRKLWAKAFPSPGPAMVSMGVARMPTATTVEITVVAVKKPESRDRQTAGVRVGQRLYLDAVHGATRVEVEKKLDAALKGGGMRRADLAAVSVYSTESREPAVIAVAALPEGARWAIFSIASTERKSETVYCDAVQAAAGGDIESQTADAFGKLRACLAAKGATLDQLVATNVYLDDIDDFTRMNATYARMFSSAFPTRTTIQPAPKAGSPLVRIGGVAVK
jgi:enamine deaminase RidA (YjgF/YER057c/UK114 family)